MTEPVSPNTMVEVPISYINELILGQTIGRRSQRNKTLVWWEDDESGVPRYAGRDLSPAEIAADEIVSKLRDQLYD